MSWVERLWAAQGKGLLNREEAWQVLLDAREAPDPGRVVDTVLHGLHLASQPAVVPADWEPVVIEDLPEPGLGDG